MEFEGGYKAEICFDPGIEMLRGEFIGLENGDADFYATDIAGLKDVGRVSLGAWKHMCREYFDKWRGVNPSKEDKNLIREFIELMEQNKLRWADETAEHQVRYLAEKVMIASAQ